MHPIQAVLGKELKDAARDRRALMSAFMFPFLAPMLIYFMLVGIIELNTESRDKPIPVIGAEHAPDLIQWLEERDYRLEPFTGDAEQAVRDKDVELVLKIPDDFEAKMRDQKQITLTIVNDGSRDDARASVSRLFDALRDYNQELASLRLMARGIAPVIMRVVTPQGKDIASKQQRTAAALNFIPLYVILAAFVAGMGIAVDASAGERERKSLESLLINPVERHYIVMGKWLASSLFAALGVALTLVLCVLAMQQVPLDKIGLQLDITLTQIVLMLLGTLPLALLATSLQLLLGIFAKSFKDAQSYIGLLTFLPLIPSLYLTFNPIATKDWMFAIPMLGQHLLLVDVLGGKEVPIFAFFLAALVCAAIGAGVVLITARLFQRESIISG